MYNESLKAKFIDAYTTSDATREVCTALFNFTEKYEEAWGRDICAADKTMLKPVVESIMGIKNVGSNIRFHLLKKYAAWCLENGVEGAVDDIETVVVTGLGAIRERMVHSPAGLQRYLDALYEPEAELTMDNIYRCWCWLAFFGAEEEESIELPRTAVNLVRHELSLSSGIVPLDSYAFPAFRNCASLDAFRYKHARYEMMRQRSDSACLLSGIRAQKSVRSMTIDLSKKAKTAFDEGRTVQRLSYSRIKKSGLFYRMEQMEAAGYPVDFTEAAEQFMDGKEYKLDKSNGSETGLRNTIAGELLKDYKNWKLAYRV